MHVSKLRILNTLPKTNIARMEDHLLLSFSNGPFLGDSFNFLGKNLKLQIPFQPGLKNSWQVMGNQGPGRLPHELLGEFTGILNHQAKPPITVHPRKLKLT